MNHQPTLSWSPQLVSFLNTGLTGGASKSEISAVVDSNEREPEITAGDPRPGRKIAFYLRFLDNVGLFPAWSGTPSCTIRDPSLTNSRNRPAHMIIQTYIGWTDCWLTFGKRSNEFAAI